MLKYLEVKNNLKVFISSLSPGDRLPGRVELCSLFNTTRVTLDKAINELEKEGLLTSRKGSGTYIPRFEEQSITGILNWCVIVPNISEKIYSELVSGIESVAHKHGANIILCNSDNDIQKQNAYIQRLLGSGVSGFIMVPVIMNDPSENALIYNNLLLSNVPFVFCNRSIEGVKAPIVTSNDFYGGYIATKHLISKGYKHIAFISERTYRTSMDRCQGYLSALLENGFEINRDLIVMPNTIKTNNYLMRTQSLLDEKKIDAAFCFNDSIAITIAEEIEKRGMMLSSDIGIIGYDNIESARGNIPLISSVTYKSKEIGMKAASILYNMCNSISFDSDFNYYLFMPEIVDRGSCNGKDTIS